MSIKKSQSYLVDSLCDQLSVWLNTQLISKVILSYTHKNVNAEYYGVARPLHTVK